MILAEGRRTGPHSDQRRTRKEREKKIKNQKNQKLSPERPAQVLKCKKKCSRVCGRALAPTARHKPPSTQPSLSLLNPLGLAKPTKRVPERGCSHAKDFGVRRDRWLARLVGHTPPLPPCLFAAVLCHTLSFFPFEAVPGGWMRVGGLTCTVEAPEGRV